MCIGQVADLLILLAFCTRIQIKLYRYAQREYEVCANISKSLRFAHGLFRTQITVDTKANISLRSFIALKTTFGTKCPLKKNKTDVEIANILKTARFFHFAVAAHTNCFDKYATVLTSCLGCLWQIVRQSFQATISKLHFQLCSARNILRNLLRTWMAFFTLIPVVSVDFQ